MKKIIKCLLILLIIIVPCTMILSSCKKDEPDKMDISVYEKWLDTNPKSAGGDYDSIDENMTPLEMFEIAIANMDYVNWMALFSVGDATTKIKVVGTIDVVQFVSTLKIIDNKNSKYFIETTSATIDGNAAIKSMNIAVLERTYRDDAGKIYYKSGKKPTFNSDGYVITEQGYEDFKTYTDTDAYQKEKINNPFIYGMYLVNEDTVLEQSATRNEALGFWTVTLKLDPALATEDYVEVMKYMVGVKATIDFKNCTFVYDIWDNGLIRSYNVVEDYDMKLLSVINGNVALNTKTYVTYDSAKYNIADYAFTTVD